MPLCLQKGETLKKPVRCWVFSPQLQLLLWMCPDLDPQCPPPLAGTHLEHLADLPAGQADVQLVHQLVDLLDVQQPIPVLVSLLEGLLYPAASVSRTGTQGMSSWTREAGQLRKESFLPLPSPLLSQRLKPGLVYGSCSQLSSHHQPLCTLVSDAGFPSENTP